MSEAISKSYDSKAAEAAAAKVWEQGDYFHTSVPADGGRNTKPYTIVIPPPNITGALHMGHAIDNTLQDILIRYKRMQGFNTLWLPGTDHAGIATQSVVEKALYQEKGLNRHDLGRRKLVEMIWQWKDEYGNRILDQLKRIGASCDWKRTRFTLDQICAKAVRHTFVNLFRKELIYRGKRLVNWDPLLQTAVADDEVEHKTIQGSFYYIKYPLVGGTGHITVATTRPETMLGDTAVAINPKDPRASSLLGKMVSLPLTDRQIKIIADDYVKKGEGTGFLKVTPAHDPNDYEIGLRHNLEQINILTPDARINENGGRYKGMDRYEARQAVVRDLQTLGLLEKIEAMEHQVGHSDRSGTPIEPYLSDQWFVKVKPLAKRAIEVVENGTIRFHPDRYAAGYLDWLYGIRDWCISRQLWWGHRIPIWYCRDCGQISTGMEDPAVCEKCRSDNIQQDPDVLDTWFSSALWPHSTLGWPEQTKELAFYYPTNTLVTARDIITLWVSRMVMMGLENMGSVPFTDVFIHGTILDGKGERMSKSKGNGIDPIDIIDTYGADAMRFSLANMTTESQDMRLPVTKDEQGRNVSEKFDIGRNFCNKLWNASRFVMMNLQGLEPEKFDLSKMDISETWILSRLAAAATDTTRLLDEFKFNEPLSAIYRFFWNDFCDWYLEWAKPKLLDEQRRSTVQNILAFVLDQILRLLHPYVPFVTEQIFQNLNEIAPVRSLAGLVELDRSQALVIAQWPSNLDHLHNPDVETQLQTIQAVIRAIRDIRSRYNIVWSRKLRAGAAGPPDTCELLNTNCSLICELAALEQFNASPSTEKSKTTAVVIVDHLQVFVHDIVDIDSQRKRLEKQKEQITEFIKATQKKLDNENFIRRAKPDVVRQTKEKFAELAQQLDTVENHLSELEN
ncbi:MAG: valine--tRNA ligase [Planctomycetota bacterium]